MNPVLSHVQAAEMISSRGQPCCKTSLDLGLSRLEVRLGEQGAELTNEVSIKWTELETLKKSKRKCIMHIGENWRDVRLMSETTGWVRALCPTSGAPTTLVSGFPMHRIKGTDPWEDTKAKINTLGKLRGRVLDTATGLGYTAIQAAESADEVVTVEIDPTAIEIARMNPWSAGLFDNDKITQIIGDVAEEIKEFPNEHFSAVIHDPPTVQYAGDLYSHSFYIELRRVLSSRGKLFHYIADPNSNHGKKLTNGVIKRLKESGFRKVARQPEAFGVLAS